MHCPPPCSPTPAAAGTPSRPDLPRPGPALPSTGSPRRKPPTAPRQHLAAACHGGDSEPTAPQAGPRRHGARAPCTSPGIRSQSPPGGGRTGTSSPGRCTHPRERKGFTCRRSQPERAPSLRGPPPAEAPLPPPLP